MRALFASLFLLLASLAFGSQELPLILSRAKELAEKGKAKEAYGELVRFREENPGVRNWGLSLMLGNLAWRLGMEDEAISYWREASSLAPEEAAPLQNLGKALFERGEFDEAARMFLKAWGLSGDSALRFYGALSLLRAGRAEEALGHLEALYQEGRKDKALLEALLDAYLKVGGEGKAEGVLREVLEAEPDRAEYWLLLAHLRDKRGDEVGAVTALKVAASLKEDRTLKERLLEGYKSLGLWLPAARLMEKDPKDPGALCDLYLLAGRPQDALRWAREAYERTGDRRWLRRAVEIQVSLGEYEGAYPILLEAVKGEEDPALWYLLGLCSLKMGRWEEAKDAFSKVRGGEYAEEARTALRYLEQILGEGGQGS